MRMPSDLLAWEPPRRQRLLLLALFFVPFIMAVTWQAARQPSLGDSDMERIALLILNRHDQADFPGDFAMQAGTWWPGYIPVYLWLIGQGYQLVGDFRVLMVGLTALVFVVLLTGAYRLGRTLQLPFMIALAFALLCGLYVTTAHALSWTGLQIENAAGRNIYLALLFWLMAAALRLWRRSAPDLRGWAMLGATMGLVANLHPINGGTAFTIFVLLMLAGAAAGRFRLRDVLVFGALALPGLALAYMTTNSKFDFPLPITAEAAAAGERYFASVYFSVARANLFFYRLPEWPPALLIYSAGLVITVAGLLYGLLRQRTLYRRWWIAFGVVQFFGALLILLADWLVLLGAALWLGRTLRRRDTQTDTLALLFLGAVCALALTGAFILSDVLPQGTSSLLSSLARALQRSGTYAYGAVALLAALGLRDLLARGARDRWPLVAAAVAAVVIGFHEAIFETIPGTWLPVDGWMYASVGVLLAWPLLDRPGWRALRYGGTAALLVQAVTRALASPAGDAVTLLVAGVAAGTALLWFNAPVHLMRRLLALEAAAVIAAAFLLPFDGRPAVVTIAQDAYRALLINWSRADRWSQYYALYRVGDWLHHNTPPGALVVADRAALRIWSHRPQVAGDTTEFSFLGHDAAQIALLMARFQDQITAYQDPDNLLAFAREHGAQYIVMPPGKYLPNLDPVFSERDSYTVYDLSEP